ncbi:ClpXP protease specificity-enhancing factor [Methylophilus sp.]|jgi:stringent starvation protein B|uniref:ClpXP protease specificity-enhancing factor n=1 Tax=Methylophilus sp. TaxID=29541 RepID=UPI0011D8E91C|nr:ClpXP protease specificity-enhancing factor [Methylophilus sp.]TXI44555.1 MAG: ClpXP protease specificity-enhancing factor [Methylophilus sp.]
MSALIPTTAYLIRAIHEWCVDNGLTPHLLVKVDAQTRVPTAYVKNGEIVLNMNYTAVKDLHIDNDAVVFSARFSGVAQHIYVPINRVAGVFARENGQGMFFEVVDGQAPEPTTSTASAAEDVSAAPAAKKSHLKVVK